jgi:hypothetical protein
MPEILAAAIAMAALLLFRHFAARQVAARRGRFVWAFAFPMVLGPAAIVWAGLRLLSTGQLIGGVLLVIGAALGTVEVMYFHRASRAVSTTPLDQDLTGALVEQTADFMLVTTIGGLIFAVVGGSALIVWAILTQRPGG